MIYTIIIRSLIIYIIVLILLRIMGKRQIGQMQPFELVITLIIADLATIPMSETALPILHGIIPLLTLCIIHYFISFLTRKSLRLRNMVNGKPVIIIGPNGIDYTALKSLNMSFNDLQESIRAAGFFNLEEILYAIIQTNGSVSVLPRAPYAPVTAEDLKIKVDEVSLPLIVLIEGKVISQNLKLANIEEDFIRNVVLNNGFKKLSEILFATINKTGEMYIQPTEGKFLTVKTKYKGDDSW